MWRLVQDQVMLISGFENVRIVGMCNDSVIATITLYYPDRVQWMFENMLICSSIRLELDEQPKKPKELDE